MTEHPIITLIRDKVSDPSQPFTIVAEFAAQHGRGDEVAAAIAKSGAIGLTRAEAGCLAYDISRDAETPDRFVAFEQWRNLAALRAHLETAHFAAVGAAIGGLLAGAPTMRVLTLVTSSR